MRTICDPKSSREIVKAICARTRRRAGVARRALAERGEPALAAFLGNVLRRLRGDAAQRLLYGTDIPIAIAPGKAVEINNQYTYVTPVPWELSISDDHEKLVFTSFLYEELRAIKTAVERLQLSHWFVQRLFWDNGVQLLKSVGRDSIAQAPHGS